MLIFTRKVGESTSIGPEIIVQVIEIKGKQVRLGFEAPRGYPIDRCEIAVAKGITHITPGRGETQPIEIGRMKNLATLLRVCRPSLPTRDLEHADFLRLSIESQLMENIGK